MSQEPNSIVNGPSTEYNTTFKDEIIKKDMPNLQQNGNGPHLQLPQPTQPPQFPQPPQLPQSPQQPQPPYQPQPGGPVNPLRPLTRVDSRSSFQFRPPFPNQLGSSIRPQQVRQPLSPGTQQYIQRNPVPGPGQRPQLVQGPPGQPYPQNRANYRPPTPFPRVPVQNQRPANLQQQRSVPAFPAPRPQYQEELIRSQTLDTTEIEHSKIADDNKNTTNEHIKAPSIAAMNNRSYSLSSNPPEPPNESKEEARRRSVSSVESLGEGRPGSRHSSISGSTENLDKKPEVEIPSRPESRSMSRMNKIVEDEDRSPSSLTEVSQKSPDLSNSPSEKSQPTVSKTPDSTSSNKPYSTKPPSPKPQAQSPKPPPLSPKPLSPSHPPQSYGPQPQSPRPQYQSPRPQPQSPRPQLQSPTNRTESVYHYQTAARPPSTRIVENGTKEGSSKTERYLNLDKPPKAKSPARSEGDNDSGVDESTQGNDQSSNGENKSPRKIPKSRTSSTTPTARSLSRGSKSPSLKSPDSNATTPGSASEKKRVPMNKIQVGSAPSPNLKVVTSKIGSLDNASYKPGGGKVKIETKKVEFKAAAPRIEAKNDKYIPKGGEKKIVQQKLHWNAKSKIGSLENASYKPKGGEKKIESTKLDFKEKAKSKVGSKDNIKYQPGGGDVKSEEIMDGQVTGNEMQKSKNVRIETKKIDLKASSKVGSLDNVKHKPGGGERKIFDDKDYLKQKSTISSVDQSLSGSQIQVHVQEVEYIESPTENMVRILNTVEEEEVLTSGRYSRCGSARRKRTAESPRPKWKF